jgi:hypothetical protein
MTVITIAYASIRFFSLFMLILLYFLLFCFPFYIFCTLFFLALFTFLLPVCMYIYTYTYAIRKFEIYVSKYVYVLLKPVFSSFLYLFFFNSGFICLFSLRLAFFLFLFLTISVLPLLFKADALSYFLQCVFKNVLSSFQVCNKAAPRLLMSVALHALKVWVAWPALIPLTTAETHPPYFELATLFLHVQHIHTYTHTHTTRVSLFSEVGFAKCTTVRTSATQDIRGGPRFVPAVLEPVPVLRWYCRRW